MSVASNRMGGLEIFTTCNLTIGHVGTAAHGCPVERSSAAGGRRNSPGGKPCQQAAGLAEPGTFAAAKEGRHGRLLVENLARPFTSFGDASLRRTLGIHD